MSKKKKPKVVFDPGCFDDFEGTQEELDSLMAEILRMAESGELEKSSRLVDFEKLSDTDPEIAEKLLSSLDDRPRR